MQEFQYNCMNGDTWNGGVQPSTNCFIVNHIFGGTGMKGGRAAGAFVANLTAASDPANTLNEYVALTANAVGSSPDNGTSSAPRGAIFGFNPLCQLSWPAANMFACVGMEVNVGVYKGDPAQSQTDASTNRKVGIQIVGLQGDHVKASGTSSVEAMLSLSRGGSGDASGWNSFSSTNAAPWSNGILIGDQNGLWPFDNTSCFICTTQIYPTRATNFPYVLNKGIDLSAVTFSGNAFASPSFVVDNAGIVYGSSFRPGGNSFALGQDQVYHDSTLGLVIAGATGGSTNDLTIANVSGAPVANIVHNGSSLDIPAANRFVFTTDTAGFVPNTAQIYRSTTNGLTFVAPNTGSTNDIGMFSSQGAELFTNPHDSVRPNDIRFGGGNGHVRTGALAPTLSSCGTSPSISGSDTAGTVTMGTASPAACIIAFQVAYATAPNCTVTWQSNLATMQYTISTTAIVLTQTATSSNKVNYMCVAQSGG